MTEEEFQKRKKEQGLKADAKFNGDFYCIETYSGLGLMGRDPEGIQRLYSPDVSDEVLGTAMVDALSLSRTLTLEEYDVFFDRESRKKWYVSWIQNLMHHYGYKTKTALFKKMQNVSIQQKEGIITLIPNRHEKLEAWGRDRDHHPDNSDYVKLPATSTSEEIGAALRLAFSRCTGA